MAQIFGKVFTNQSREAGDCDAQFSAPEFPITHTFSKHNNKDAGGNGAMHLIQNTQFELKKLVQKGNVVFNLNNGSVMSLSVKPIPASLLVHVSVQLYP